MFSESKRSSGGIASLSAISAHTVQNAGPIAEIALLSALLCANTAPSRIRQLRVAVDVVRGIRMASRTMRPPDVLVAGPTLAHHVAHVVGCRSNEQVRRPNTISHVALVTHEQSVGNGAERKLPRHTMRSDLSLEANVDGAMENRVTLLGATGPPQPTVRLRSEHDRDLSPEPMRLVSAYDRHAKECAKSSARRQAISLASHLAQCDCAAHEIGPRSSSRRTQEHLRDTQRGARIRSAGRCAAAG